MVGTAVFIGTCEHTDRGTDLPKVASAFVPAAKPAPAAFPTPETAPDLASGLSG